MAKISKEKVKVEKSGWIYKVMAVYVIAVLAVLPVIFRNYYYDIMNVKYYYYLVCTIAAFALAVIYLIFFVRPKGIKLFFENIKGKKLLNLLSVTDIAVIVFGVIVTISCLTSDFHYEAFWGNEGRYTGMFLLLLYAVVYFLITRCFKFKNWYVDIALAAGMAVCLFGLSDFLGMDVLNFKEHTNHETDDIFTSFIGNINFYTAIISIYMGAACALWVSCKDKLHCFWYYINVCVTFLALITGISDSAYIALAAIFAFLPIYAFRTRRGTRRYVVTLATFLTSFKVIQWVSINFADRVKRIDSLYNKIVGFDKLWIIIVCLWVLALILYVVDYSMKKQGAPAWKGLCRIWIGLVVLVFIGAVAVIVDVNAFGNGARYGSAREYLEFKDSWGTNRGFAWRIAVEDYMDFSLVHKIFGFGPDTFGLVTYFNNYQEMASKIGQLFDSVHNEYLQYFVTIGPIGLAAYLTIFISAFVSAVRRGVKDHPYIVAMIFGVLCYSAQAVVNINQPIATPIMWTFLCMSVSWIRRQSIDKAAGDKASNAL